MEGIAQPRDYEQVYNGLISGDDFLRMMTEGITGYSKAEVLTKI